MRRAGVLCRWCGKRVARKDGAIEFATVRSDGREGYPWGQPPSEGHAVGWVTHYECGPDTGYWIGLDRLGEPHLREHLATKHGWSEACEEAYLDACAAFGVAT